MPKSRRLRGTRRIKSRRMRGGNEEDAMLLGTAEEDANMTGPNVTVETPEVTVEQSDKPTISTLNFTEKAKKTATNAVETVKNLGRTFGNWLGFGGKSRKNHRKSRKNRRKSRKNRKH